MEISIDELNIPQEPLIAKKISIKIGDIKFSESATFFVYFYNTTEITSLFNESNIIKTQVVVIEGDEYKNWKDDDQYIIDLICNKLGITQSTQVI